ncbi:class F sortase [Streptomyces sp. NRRL F-5126]|uniref:class F sortase n=1 Tax=Streptomyces sp. NRRL F-5126 TaxID=1463857 RepID=UPI0004C88C83|nr:class F sortase [Streptomyces sp. NRRL F-5126]
MTLPFGPFRRSFAAAALASVLVAGGAVGCGAPAPGHHVAAGGSHASPSPSRHTAATGAVQALARSVPVRLEIPSIGVDTPVMRLGLDADGTVQVPPITSHDRAGWYRNSPTPGQVGPSVILAHVTVGAYGDGVFRHLAQVREGDRIAVHLEDGKDAVFAARSVRTVAKSRFPTDAVYGDVDRPELRLITCGGPRSGDGYRDNVIVFADLVPAAS